MSKTFPTNSEEVENIETENPNVEKSEEFWPLSQKPFFDVVLTKTLVKPHYQLYLPIKLNPMLPPPPFRAVFVYQGKTWKTTFSRNKRQDVYRAFWKAFVKDNDLKIGDACLFELDECGAESVKFKVQILRGDFPDELMEKADGETSNTPIVLD